MEKLKCNSCGGEMTIDESKEYATCKYCGMKYKLNDDLNVNIKIDDSVKDVLNTGLSTAKHFSLFMLFPIIVFIIIIATAIFFTFKTSNENKDFFNDTEEKINDMYDDIKNNNEVDVDIDDVSKARFNLYFTNQNGTQYKMLVENLLDHIIDSNKKYNRKIVLVYGDISTTDENEIINIKHKLDKPKYEVRIDYDSDGYVNKITLEDIN